MEAENYDEIIPGADTSYWEGTTEPDEYSGTGAMQTLANDSLIVQYKTLSHAQLSKLEYKDYIIRKLI